MRVTQVIITVVAGSLLGSTGALAGDLNPPGAPAPTMKTLDEVEPRIPVGPLTTPGDADSVYKITQSGSYYLTGNVLGGDRLSGVEIAASGVTLDLMGFECIGLVFDGASQSGVRVTQAGALNIVIRNGAVRAWDDDGIDASLAASVVIEDIVAAQNIRTGVRAEDRAILRRVTAVSNGVEGVRVRGSCLVTEVIASDNTIAGVVVGGNALVERSVATGSDDGMIAEGVGARFVDCLASNNTMTGFVGVNGFTADGCIARDNGLDGFALGASARVIDSKAYNNGDDGISVLGNSFISGCIANDNGSNGVEGQAGGTTVLNTKADRNDFPGIGLVDGDNHVENCSVSNQFGATAGIGVTGANNQIIGNRVRVSGVGIRVSGVSTGGVVAKNVVTGVTTPFDVSGGALLAPVRVTPAGAGAWDNIGF